MTPQELAGWDIDALRRASADFTSTAAASRHWVLRGDAIGLALSAPAAWDGPASEAALSSLGTWLAVVARLTPALEALAAGVADAVSWYAQAQDAAASACRAAATAGVVVGADGSVIVPAGPTGNMDADQAAAAVERAAAAAAVQALIDDALRLAARGDALVASDIGVFRGLAMPGFTASSDFADLMVALHVPIWAAGRLPTVPSAADPAAVAEWWAGLSLDVQLRLSRERPALIGGLDGVPAWARDTANRILLEEALRGPLAELADPQTDLWDTLTNEDLYFALSVRAALAQAEALGQPVQLYLFDPEQNLAAISVGDLDTADSVAVIVPGTAVDVTGDMDAQVTRAGAVWSASAQVDDTETVAVLAWIGYDTPNIGSALLPFHAAAGAPLLAGTVNGISAARTTPPARTTVIAHSYGTLTTRYAAAQPDDLGADAVVLLGSPGTRSTAAGFDLPADRVFVGEGEEDWIADSAFYGTDPSWDLLYGGTCISADMPDEDDSDHYHYFDAESEALRNMALIVQGRYGLVVGCDD